MASVRKKRFQPSDLTNVFTDTCVLLNYIQRGVERDYTSDLIDGNQVDIVVGVTVADELEAVSDRRGHIYADFVDFLLEDNGEIGDYDLDSRRPYFQPNDHGHIRNIQMRLSQLDERSEIQRQLRQFTRAAKRRVEYLLKRLSPNRNSNCSQDLVPYSRLGMSFQIKMTETWWGMRPYGQPSVAVVLACLLLWTRVIS